jgi:hypothetical protein
MRPNFSEKHSIGNWISSTREGKELGCAGKRESLIIDARAVGYNVVSIRAKDK